SDDATGPCLLAARPPAFGQSLSALSLRLSKLSRNTAMPPHSTRSTGIITAAAATAVAAAATAAWVVHRKRRAERLHPPLGSFVDVEGVRVHYVERGDGPPVVLLHGNLMPLQDAIASGLVDDL